MTEPAPTTEAERQAADERARAADAEYERYYPDSPAPKLSAEAEAIYSSYYPPARQP